MKVKLLVPICGPDGSFKAGDEPDLPEALTKALVKDGNAEQIIEETVTIVEGRTGKVIEEIKPEVKTGKKTVNKK